MAFSSITLCIIMLNVAMLSVVLLRVRILLCCNVNYDSNSFIRFASDTADELHSLKFRMGPILSNVFFCVIYAKFDPNLKNLGPYLQHFIFFGTYKLAN
jgi:hypothetical protein